ncbi:MAG: hypothetical protein OXI88_14580 [Gammaproteobacteria bacterium]|nr:hypothetical protein [Gammaproteobacteria bacterium]
MARGNDGNYLQHCIEVEAAVRLAEMDAAGRLHISLTHGMEPFERFKPFALREQQTPYYQLLKNKLEDSKQPSQVDESAVVKAYRETGASDTRYPNSAELLRAVIGAENLSGGITEICTRKHKSLSSAWVNTNVKTACASWREEICTDGILACPEDLQSSWLFSMDPMTYKEEGYMDDDRLYHSDIGILSCAISRYFRSGRPGVAALFVYNIGVQKNNTQCQFANFIKELKEWVKKRVSDNLAVSTEVATSCFSLQHTKRKRNLAGLIHSSEIDLSAKLKSACIDLGIAPGRSLAARL